MSIVFIIGMPGSGKSHWGHAVAMTKGIPFIDLDEYIEARQHKTIAEFFSQNDEKAFRTIENALLVEIIKKHKGDLIVACGGGTPCYKDNFSLMKKNGIVIYLKATVTFLANRLKGHIDKRPLLSGHAELKARLRDILKERKKIYEQADYIFAADSVTPLTFDEIIKNV
jgi:shikimate kinase